MTSISIPIRFSPVEKYILETEARISGKPLSTYIKSLIQKTILSKVKKMNKSNLLIEKLNQAKLINNDIDIASQHGQSFRQSFDLRID